MKVPQPAAALEQPDPFQHLSPEPWHEPQNSMLLKTAIQRSTQSGPTGAATGLGVGCGVGRGVGGAVEYGFPAHSAAEVAAPGEPVLWA